jgi:hypothetical protein
MRGNENDFGCSDLACSNIEKGLLAVGKWTDLQPIQRAAQAIFEGRFGALV